MKERLFRLTVEDVRISAVFFENAFSAQSTSDFQWSMAYLTQLHQHSTYEIFFVPNGELGVVTEDSVIENREAVVIIPPFVNHYTLPRTKGVYCFCFSFERSGRGERGLYDAIFPKLSDGVISLDISADERFYIDHLADAIKSGTQNEDTRHLLSLLFSEIFSRLAPRQTLSKSGAGKHGVYINTVDTYISDHYKESVSLEDLARELYLCSKQVSRIIRREYGCSLSQLVNKRRLAVACMLLKYTSMPISEISATVGYSHENYFFTMFRKEYGVTPKKYRDESSLPPQGEP